MCRKQRVCVIASCLIFIHSKAARVTTLISHWLLMMQSRLISRLVTSEGMGTTEDNPYLLQALHCKEASGSGMLLVIDVPLRGLSSAKPFASSAHVRRPSGLQWLLIKCRSCSSGTIGVGGWGGGV